MNTERAYRIERQLGEGAFGAVYLARTVGTGLERRVAIKVLHAEHAALPGLVKRLRDEARVLNLIHHRAIVRVDDLVLLNGEWAMVMEFVDGCDVARLLRRGPLPPRPAAEIAAEVASALHAGHTQPGPGSKPLLLVHRDIKPGNVRITASGEVKLLDFGVARAEFASREAATTNLGFGTVAYMAPERFEGHDLHVGDVYSLGVMLFEMVTGTRPGDTAMSPERRRPGRRLQAEWAAIEEVGGEFASLVERMLEPEPHARPSAREVALALRDLAPRLRGEGLAEYAETAVGPVASSSSTATDPSTGSLLVERLSADATPAERPTRRSASLRWLALPLAGLVALLVAATVSGGSWLIWSRLGERGGTDAAERGTVVPGRAANAASASAPATQPAGEPAAPPSTATSPPKAASTRTPTHATLAPTAPTQATVTAPTSAAVAADSPSGDAAPSAPSTGKLTITTDPTGAKVAVDGAGRGRAPLTLELPVGEHTVRVEADGYGDVTRTVSVGSAGLAVPFKLEGRKVGQVSVFGPGDASVEIDGHDFGGLPVSANLMEGVHTFTVRTADGQSCSLSKDVQLASPVLRLSCPAADPAPSNSGTANASSRDRATQPTPAAACGSIVVVGEGVTLALAVDRSCAPPGAYAGTATFPSGAAAKVANIEVVAGQTTTVTCNVRFERCAVSR